MLKKRYRNFNQFLNFPYIGQEKWISYVYSLFNDEKSDHPEHAWLFRTVTSTTFLDNNSYKKITARRTYEAHFNFCHFSRILIVKCDTRRTKEDWLRKKTGFISDFPECLKKINKIGKVHWINKLDPEIQSLWVGFNKIWSFINRNFYTVLVYENRTSIRIDEVRSLLANSFRSRWTVEMIKMINWSIFIFLKWFYFPGPVNYVNYVSLEEDRYFYMFYEFNYFLPETGLSVQLLIY